ncbi:MAG TPA: VIT domain-containing protein [Pyrinomonadaceae bacterium]|nr:VIT domain-containing protein [Pyrinomonadaceae bacterium]
MHIKSIFKWITLSTFALGLTLFLLGLKSHDLAHAALQKTDNGTQGALLVIDSKGNPAGACPLKHTSVRAEISGFLSRVTVTQEFENPFADKIEAVYLFPLPQAAAVDDMTMKVGERTVKGKIMRREEAQATYNAAKAKGQVASLLDQERPNIFTQSVANIMPGEKITIDISYVETLKYEDGAYEFSFPMVVGERYIPGHSTEEAPSEQTKEAQNEQTDEQTIATTAERVPDAARITPPAMPKGMRAGHDISIEIALDAGVPIDNLKSLTHEIEVEKPDDRRALIRLKDQQTIPNKDFVLKYDVAGSRIEDAVLTHRAGRGGFFTLILQPPERVTFEDVMPKELVFVLDTSGSMQGFPIEKAKETMKLALDHLYPQDTFNVITFSGDTDILFKEPVPATPDNLQKAQKFLERQSGNGGTEMMKAIVAALKPSDAQDHLRIACFMTDGYVGNDMEIIGEVQKYKNARVFAMGFGGSSNRFLLDKMAEYGRGEVEYVMGESDGSDVARRFFERVRSPLLTDITIDYAGLSISDVYPQRIPDLFSAKPLILSGRYAAGGRGTIRLKGRMSGRDVVREIPVELPDQAPEHDVLATLWARRRIDDLMGQQMGGATGTAKDSKSSDALREAITQLGLQYRLMTQFTSFVAVEEKVVTDSSAPQRVVVPTEAPDSGGAPGSLNAAVSVSTGGSYASGVQETVNVTAGGAELIQTTTTQLSKSYNERQVTDLAQTNVGGAYGGGVNNLALLAPNVASAGGVGAGVGGSVGGQRPRNNTFMIDGVDNNDKAATGPQTYVSPENVAEFSLVQNQFSAEFGRSTGGQFLTITKSGTNDFHGSVYGFFRNRYLNALDNAQQIAGVVRENPPPPGATFMPRYDFFRGGMNLGGPVFVPTFGLGARRFYDGRDKLFFYGAYERLQQGAAASHLGITTPTAQGLTALNAIPGLSQTNLSVFNLYAPVAPVNDAGTINVNGVSVPIGNTAFTAANFLKQNNVLANIDYNQSTKTTQHWHFNLTNNAAVDTRADLPAFYALQTNKQRLFSYGLFHTFNANLANETRMAYRRSEVNTPAPNILFPGLGVFPNIGLAELGLDIGPSTIAPQSVIENNYQLVDTVSYVTGNHFLKLGGDFRHIISPQRYDWRERGRYDYSTAALFLSDLSPDLFGERSTTGGTTYYGNQNLFYAFMQDDWRARPNVTLNLGVGYSYQQMPVGARQQALNAVSSVPGLIAFNAPGTQKRNFAPKFGIAYSPNFTDGLLGRVFGSNGKSAVRAGFSLGYDYIFDQFYSSSQPPQLAQTLSVPDLTAQTPNFLGSGAIPSVSPPAAGDAAAARRATSSFIPDQEVPYSLTWSLSLQRQFMSDWSVELRYLGTRGVHLLTQNRINRIGKVGVAGREGLPTFLAAPAQAELDALRAQLTLEGIRARSNYVQGFDAAGFNGANVSAFLSNGNSIYHGAAAELRRRFSNGFEMSAAYTWSHLMDDSTAELFSTVLSPHRAEEFQDLRRERADSALDRRHRFVVSAIYELPFFKNNSGGIRSILLGGFNFTGTWTLESGERATVLSGIDANLNGDTAGDRTVRNPDGVRNTASAVIPLLATCAFFNADGTCAQSDASRTVGYLAVNPSAEYIQAGPGAVSNSARNTLLLPGINNVDFTIFKNFRFGEGSKKLQLRADFFNLFNHAQYVPGSVNEVSPVQTAGVRRLNTAGFAQFNRPDLIFSGHPRVIQIALRFDF